MKLSKRNNSPYPTRRFWLSAIALLSTIGLYSQTTITQQLTDITVPSTATSVYVELKGGDGGNAAVTGASKCRANGGSGTLIKVTLPIGNADNQIPPGSTLRFIKGQKGGSEDFYNAAGAGDAGGAGGGGSAVLYRRPGSLSDQDWIILAVAGGGGGAYAGMFAYVCTDDYGGKGANDTTYGDDGSTALLSNTGGGRDGEAGTSILTAAGGGAGALESADLVTSNGHPAQKGWPNGGSGGQCAGCKSGGFGFGGGGFAFYGPGGGGGYSGGGAGSVRGAGGGGSFVHPMGSQNLIKAGSDGAGNESDGYLRYQFDPEFTLLAPFTPRSIQLAAAPDKCLDTYGKLTANGTNIQLWNCNGGTNQTWFFDAPKARSNMDQHKCLYLKDGQTTNGTNVQLNDCHNDWNSEKWIYDGMYGTIRTYAGFRKCLSVEGSSNNPPAGTNIHIWDCKDNNVRQQWQIADATKVENPSGVKTIRPVAATGLCLDIEGAQNQAGVNVQLWTCNDPNAEWEEWTFDLDGQIHLNAHADKCLGVMYQTNNVHIWNCQGDNWGQVWIYDGISQSIRWGENKSKCFQVNLGNGIYEKRDNLEIADCDGDKDQRFVVQGQSVCDLDTTPPVAKCKDATYPNLTAPEPNDVDAGSTDNCQIQSRDLTNVSGSTYRLTITDQAGNTSSCTATVSFQ